MFELDYPTPLQEIPISFFSDKEVSVFMKREDLIDTEISGNKWRKLKYNLKEAKTQGYSNVLTFGGAYSNHIAATAAACKRYGFNSIGVIRGEELNEHSNPTLQQAAADGMNLHFISRKEYQNRDNQQWLQMLAQEHQAYIIPEGGTNDLAVRGVTELVHEIDIDFDTILCPVGTGGTLAGIVEGLHDRQKAIGISTLKGESYLKNIVNKLTTKTTSWKLNHEYHFGGYAKFNNHLIEFINQFYLQTQIPLDPIYTGKMMYGLFDLLKNGFFSDGCRIICVHTGGTQGIAGFNNQHQNALKT